MGIDTDICRLCGGSGLLRESHILPGFVTAWIKRTSATGKLRNAEEPNLRRQDSFKHKLLCDDCEQRFSDWEKVVSERLFLPLHEENVRYLPYETWLLKFAVSVSWRTIIYLKILNEPKHLSPKQVRAAEKAEKHWRAFLLDEETFNHQYQHHILPMGLIKSGPSDLPAGINFYITRTVEMDLVTAGSNVFVFSKMCGLVIVGFINRSMNYNWKGTRISVFGGTVGEHEMSIPKGFLNYFQTQGAKSMEVMNNLSARQKEKIDVDFEKSETAMLGSKTFEAILSDYVLSGGRAFVKKD